MSWPTVPLGDVAKWGSGGTPKRSERANFGPGIPWLSIADLNDGPVSTAKESLTPLGLANSSAKVVPAGTVLVAMYGSIGKLGIAEAELCTSQAIAFARPDIGRLDTRYLFYFLLAERQKLLAMGRGGTQMNIGQADLKAWPIPLPTLKEQRRIADILDRADALRAKRRQAITLLDDLPQSIFLEVFGDLRSNPRGFEVRPFGEVCETRLGKMLDAKQQTGADKRAYLRNANVQWFRFDLDDMHTMDFDDRARAQLRLVPGDLLICEGGEPGRSAVWRGAIEECYFQKALHRARPDCAIALPDYLAWYLWFASKRGALKDYVTSATIAHLTGEKLRTLPVLCPPMGLQEAFVDRLETLRHGGDDSRRHASALNDLFATLQQRSFAGHL